MKKPAFTFLTLMVTVLLFTQCKKDDAIHETQFYTSNVNQERLTLFVDGQAIGNLPAFSTPLTCDSNPEKQPGLKMTLKSGKYHLQAKDSLGTVKSGAMMKVFESSGGGSSTIGETGGMAMQMSGSGNSCVIVNLFY